MAAEKFELDEPPRKKQCTKDNNERNGPNACILPYQFGEQHFDRTNTFKQPQTPYPKQEATSVRQENDFMQSSGSAPLEINFSISVKGHNWGNGFDLRCSRVVKDDHISSN